MWAEIVKNTPGYRDAVLSAPDDSGYPCSVRCLPELDQAARVVRLALPPGVALQPGAASLLCHSHDENLWSLRSVNLRGSLERDERGWFLRPRQFIPGGGTGGLLGTLKQIRDLRRSAARYLAKRGLTAPTIPWARIAGAKVATAGGARAADTTKG